MTVSTDGRWREPFRLAEAYDVVVHLHQVEAARMLK